MADDLHGHDELALRLYHEGLVLLESEDFEAGKQLFLQSFALCPHFATCRRIAQSLRASGNPNDADIWTARAFELNPKSDKAAVEYAEVLLRRSLVCEARRLLQQILDRNSDYGPARSMLEKLERDEPRGLRSEPENGGLA